MNKILRQIIILLSMMYFNSNIYAMTNYKELGPYSTTEEVLELRSLIAKDISRHVIEIKQNLYKNLSTEDIELNNHVLYLNIIELYKSNLYQLFSEKLSNPNVVKVNEFINWWSINNNFSLNTWIDRCHLSLDKSGKNRKPNCNLGNKEFRASYPL